MDEVVLVRNDVQSPGMFSCRERPCACRVGDATAHTVLGKRKRRSTSYFRSVFRGAGGEWTAQQHQQNRYRRGVRVRGDEPDLVAP